MSSDGLENFQSIAQAAAAAIARPSGVCDRAFQARAEDMRSLPHELRIAATKEVESVVHLCESPIEQVALYQLAGFNWGNEEFPARARILARRGEIEHYPDLIHIIPQVEFAPFRLDFLIDAGGKKLFGFECDGEEFHQDKAKDQVRDQRLEIERGVRVYRVPGTAIWRGANVVHVVASIIKKRIFPWSQST